MTDLLPIDPETERQAATAALQLIQHPELPLALERRQLAVKWLSWRAYTAASGRPFVWPIHKARDPAAPKHAWYENTGPRAVDVPQARQRLQAIMSDGALRLARSADLYWRRLPTQQYVQHYRFVDD